jgi:hypothetical protein
MRVPSNNSRTRYVMSANLNPTEEADIEMPVVYDYPIMSLLFI